MTVRDLLGRKSLRQWHPLLRQAVSAYRRSHYAITVPALLTILEGVIMCAEGDRIKPWTVIDERITSLEATSPELFTIILWRLCRECVLELYKKSQFSGPKPAGLNRHWILHGRDVADWGHADSLRLFQAVDTVSSLS